MRPIPLIAALGVALATEVPGPVNGQKLAFDRADTDCDGVISMAELEALRDGIAALRRS